jgi:hypothetical protein
MGNFKVLDTVPDVGNIKFGGTNVKRIYKGNSWIWPPEDDSYAPVETVNRTNCPTPGPVTFIANVSRNTEDGDLASVNGFNLLRAQYDPTKVTDTLQEITVVSPANPFGSLPSIVNDPDHQAGVIAINKEQIEYSIYKATVDYKYMIAIARVQPSFSGASLSQCPYLGGFLCDRILHSSDFGQSWQTMIDLKSLGGFDGVLLLHMSKNGQTVFLQYRKNLNNTDIVTDPNTNKKYEHYNVAYINLISNNYGQTFREKKLKVPNTVEYIVNNTYSGRLFDTLQSGIRNYFIDNGNNFEFNTISNKLPGEGATSRPTDYNFSEFTSINKSDSDVLIGSFEMSSTGKVIFFRTRNQNSFNNFYLSTDFGYNFTDITQSVLNADSTPYNFDMNTESVFTVEEMINRVNKSTVAVTGDGKKITIFQSAPTIYNQSIFTSFDYGEHFDYNGTGNNLLAAVKTLDTRSNSQDGHKNFLGSNQDRVLSAFGEATQDNGNVVPDYIILRIDTRVVDEDDRAYALIRSGGWYVSSTGSRTLADNGVSDDFNGYIQFSNRAAAIHTGQHVVFNESKFLGSSLSPKGQQFIMPVHTKGTSNFKRRQLLYFGTINDPIINTTFEASQRNISKCGRVWGVERDYNQKKDLILRGPNEFIDSQSGFDVDLPPIIVNSN